jgi:chemotaxis protein methyltransferase CheR
LKKLTAVKENTAVSDSDPVLLFLDRRIEEILGIKAAPEALLKVKEYMEKSRGSPQTDLDAYNNLFSSPAGISTVARLVTINETYFFRESVHFKLLMRRFIPQFARLSRTIRICSAAASTGCEAYSLAMLMDFYARGKELFLPDPDISASIRGIPFTYGIDAFDVNPDVIKYAQNGRYTNNTLREDGAEWRSILDLYLKNDNKEYIIAPFLREKVNFFTHNIMKGINGHYDLIFFRNALIYFSQENRLKILNYLVNALTEGGFLILGVSETSSIEHPMLENIAIPGVFYFRKRAANKGAHAGDTDNVTSVVERPDLPDRVESPNRRTVADRRTTEDRRTTTITDRRVTADRRTAAERRTAADRRTTEDRGTIADRRAAGDRGTIVERRTTADRSSRPNMQGIIALLEREEGRSNAKHVEEVLEQAGQAADDELAAAAITFLGAEKFGPADRTILALEKTNNSAAASFLRGEYCYLHNDAAAAEEKYREASMKDPAFWPAFYRMGSLAAGGNRTRYEYKIKKALESMDAGKEFHYEAFIGGFSPDYYRRILERKLTE